jgi:hypothetical protein
MFTIICSFCSTVDALGASIASAHLGSHGLNELGIYGLWRLKHASSLCITKLLVVQCKSQNRKHA